jgi:hypothetical protein
MVFFRVLFTVLILAAMGCFAMSLFTRQPVWRQRGIAILKWTVIAALGTGLMLWLPTVLPVRP